MTCYIILRKAFFFLCASVSSFLLVSLRSLLNVVTNQYAPNIRGLNQENIYSFFFFPDKFAGQSKWLCFRLWIGFRSAPFFLRGAVTFVVHAQKEKRPSQTTLAQLKLLVILASHLLTIHCQKLVIW